MKHIRSSPAVLLLIVGATAAATATNAIWAWMATLLIRKHHLEIHEAGLVLACRRRVQRRREFDRRAAVGTVLPRTAGTAPRRRRGDNNHCSAARLSRNLRAFDEYLHRGDIDTWTHFGCMAVADFQFVAGPDSL